MKKRIVILGLILCMIFSLGGCGKSDPNNTSEGDNLQYQTESLDGVWECNLQRGDFLQLIIKNTQCEIWFYESTLSGLKSRLKWIGVYTPLEGIVSEYTWKKEPDFDLLSSLRDEGKAGEGSNGGFLDLRSDFTYKDGKVSVDYLALNGDTIDTFYFEKVEE